LETYLTRQAREGPPEMALAATDLDLARAIQAYTPHNRAMPYDKAVRGQSQALPAGAGAARIEEYATGLKEIIEKLRRKMN